MSGDYVVIFESGMGKGSNYLTMDRQRERRSMTWSILK